MDPSPRVGQWAKTGELVGLVAAAEDSEVTLFDPAARQQVTVPAASVTVLPAGAVDVTMTVTLPLPHGLGAEDVRRWVAALADDRAREQARQALTQAGLDAGAAQPVVDVQVTASEGSACLCGQPPALEPGAAQECPGCGRQAVGPPPRAR